MAREKARLVIAERTKIKREMEETEPPPKPEETEPPTPPPEPPAELPAEDSAPEPEETEPPERSERVQPITHPRDFTRFQNLFLLEPETFPNRVGVLVFDE